MKVVNLQAWDKPEQSIYNNKGWEAVRSTLKGEGQLDITALKVSYYS